MNYSSETLDRISRSGEAVFAIDSSDRVVLWNKKCEELLGKPAKSVLGKRCDEVIGGRDAQGNIYCYRSCPVAYQAREKASEPVARFPLTIQTGKGKTREFEMSMFAIPSYHPALSIVVHVLREGKKNKPSALEKGLERDASTREPLWPMATREGEPITLTAREKEILRHLAQGQSTAQIGKSLFISTVTVRNHIQAILGKLDVHSKLEAVVFAFQHSLV
ncbi:MAG: LuxR C-terminal-related transcriptional regulator [Acidobacteriota bacterium]|nr:LuxR C-terminal-related transcriptional regulator [Acidobacteriota bacterium]